MAFCGLSPTDISYSDPMMKSKKRNEPKEEASNEEGRKDDENINATFHPILLYMNSFHL